MYRYRRPRGRSNTSNGIVTPKDRHDIARQIASVMSRQRRGLEAPEFGKRSGKIDRRRLASTATGNEAIFSQRQGRSTSRLKVVVLLDLSGSMRGSKVQDAVQTAWDFVLAAKMVPTMSLEVWGHTTGYLNTDEKPLPEVLNQEKHEAEKDDANYKCSGVREGHYVAAYQLVDDSVTNSRQFYQQLKHIQLSGNEDGWAIEACLSDVTRRAKSNERVLLIVVSDGAPIYAERKQSLGHVKAVVQRWRRRGVGVISVSVDGSLRKQAQANMYGNEWVVPFMQQDGLDWWELQNLPDGINKPTVVAMGRVIGRALN